MENQNSRIIAEKGNISLKNKSDKKTNPLQSQKKEKPTQDEMIAQFINHHIVV